MYHTHLLALILFFLGTPSWADAKSASDFCPKEIDVNCLEAIADRIISAQSDKPARSELALAYATTLLPKGMDHAASTIEKYSADADWRALRRVFDAFAQHGQADVAEEYLWRSAEARANDPTKRFKVLDMLLLAEDAAEFGNLPLARRVHLAAVSQLEAQLDEPVPFSDHLRLSRLMVLYGWPEDAHAVLEDVYAQTAMLAEDTQALGITLNSILTVALLAGHEDLSEQVAADISAIVLNPDRTAGLYVREGQISALAQAGFVEEAKAQAKTSGIDFDAQVGKALARLLDHETSYYPGFSEDTLRRFDAILGAVESPEFKAESLALLANRMMRQDYFDGIEDLLSLVEDPNLRSELVLELMTYHARERKDPKTAADLYFDLGPEIMPINPSKGTLLQRYPLSVTAIGLLEAGDLERGGQLSDIILTLWAFDLSEHRRAEGLLVGALAAAGDTERFDQWYSASDDPIHKMEVLYWAERARIKSGQFNQYPGTIEKMSEVLPLISDEPRQQPSYLPKEWASLSLRGEEALKIRGLEEDLITALLDAGDLPAAMEKFRAHEEGGPVRWNLYLAIAQEFDSTGQTEEAFARKSAVLGRLLSGETAASEMPYIMTWLYPS